MLFETVIGSAIPCLGHLFTAINPDRNDISMFTIDPVRLDLSAGDPGELAPEPSNKDGGILIDALYPGNIDIRFDLKALKEEVLGVIVQSGR